MSSLGSGPRAASSGVSIESHPGAKPGTLAVRGAEGVLLPPEPGLGYLRHDRAAQLRVEPGSLALAQGRIAAIEDDPGAERAFDATGLTVVPGLIDAHTHLPFAGWRAAEYAQKVAGASYEEVARSGGGIASSARALAESSDDAVVSQAAGLALEMLEWGTTSFETKSGYGLSVDAEIRSLRLAGALAHETVQSVVSTALVAHALPDGYDPEGWLDAVEAALPAMLEARAVRALDVYVESVAFANAQLERVGVLAATNGLALRAHVEQFACHRSVGVALAAGARSVDHLACMDERDIPQLARAECAAVLLPGAELLGAEKVAPGRRLADAGAICVLASDANPGTSPVVSLPVIVGLAVRRYGWTALEAALACTLNAAWTIGCSDVAGSIEPGKRADLVLLDGPLEMLPYRFGHNPVVASIVAGEVVHLRERDRWRLSE